MKAIRLKDLEDFITEHNTVSFDVLATELGVSLNTIRRDIAILVEKGVIKKVHGGVEVIKKSENTTPFQMRSIKLQQQKDHIGQLAAKLIEDGDVIFVDSGTTTLQLFHHIKDKNITILTNNLNMIMLCADLPNINLICTGGKLYHTTNSFIGTQALSCIQTFNIQKAFMAATGLSLHRGCTNSSSLEFEVKKAVIERSDKIYLMADHTKFGVVSLMTFCKADNLTGVITDEVPSAEYRTYFNNHHITCLY